MMGYSKAEIFGNAALRPEQVRAVRLRRGESPRVVAADYGVAPETIRKIWRGDTYTMISDEGPALAQQVSSAELQASLARTLALAGLPPMPAVGQPPASLEEALKAQAIKESTEPSPGLARLAQEAAGGRRIEGLLDELAGHDSPSVISWEIPPALGGTSTDGEAK